MVYGAAMPKHRGLDGPPRSYLVSGQWPTGRIDEPVVARYVAAVSQSLQEAIGSRPLREVARAADLQHTTVRALLAGEVWPDLVTIAKLEQALGVRLWPEGLPSSE